MEGNLWAGEDVLKALHRLRREGVEGERQRCTHAISGCKRKYQEMFCFSGSQNYRFDRVHRNQHMVSTTYELKPCEEMSLISTLFFVTRDFIDRVGLGLDSPSHCHGCSKGNRGCGFGPNPGNLKGVN